MIDPTALQRFSASLRDLPRTTAIEIAKEAAPLLTRAMQATFRASTDAFGNAWMPAKDGSTVTLNKSGGIASGVFFTAIGTKLRVILGVRHAKYQIGRRPIAPKQGEILPPAWRNILKETAARVLAAKARAK